MVPVKHSFSPAGFRPSVDGSSPSAPSIGPPRPAMAREGVPQRPPAALWRAKSAPLLNQPHLGQIFHGLPLGGLFSGVDLVPSGRRFPPFARACPNVIGVYVTPKVTSGPGFVLEPMTLHWIPRSFPNNSSARPNTSTRTKRTGQPDFSRPAWRNQTGWKVGHPLHTLHARFCASVSIKFCRAKDSAS